MNGPERRFLPIVLPALVAIALAWPLEVLARPQLNLRGRVEHIGSAPNALSPGGEPGTFVVGDLDGGWISLRSAADGGLLRSIHVGGSTLGLAAAPLAQELYAANVRGSTVYVVDMRVGGLADQLVVGQSANLVASSADGRFVIATAYDPQLVSVFDREFNFTRRTLVLDDRPAGLVVTRNRFPPRAYVAGIDRGKIFTLEFDPSNFVVVDSLLIRPGASFIVLSPDESMAYISSGGNRVIAVDIEGGFVEREIPVGGEPLGLDVSPDGQFVLVANSASDTVSLIATDRQIVVDEITVGGIPTDVLFVSDGRAFVALQGDNALAVVDLYR